MSMMTSSYNSLYQPPVSFPSIDPGRSLGATYKFFQQTFLCRSRYFLSIEKYNEQEEGYQGFSFGGRWLWKPINDNNITYTRYRITLPKN